MERYFLPPEITGIMIEATVIWGGICLAIEIVLDIIDSAKEHKEEE